MLTRSGQPAPSGAETNPLLLPHEGHRVLPAHGNRLHAASVRQAGEGEGRDPRAAASERHSVESRDAVVTVDVNGGRRGGRCFEYGVVETAEEATGLRRRDLHLGGFIRSSSGGTASVGRPRAGGGGEAYNIERRI